MSGNTRQTLAEALTVVSLLVALGTLTGVAIKGGRVLNQVDAVTQECELARTERAAFGKDVSALRSDLSSIQATLTGMAKQLDRIEARTK